MHTNRAQCQVRPSGHVSEVALAPVEKLHGHGEGSDFVVISRFAVANGMVSQVKDAFRNRAHKVDDTDGFRRMEVISPLDCPHEIWLVTFWRDEMSYRVWHHSQAYRDAHKGIPKGLKLVPKSAAIRCFESVSK